MKKPEGWPTHCGTDGHTRNSLPTPSQPSKALQQGGCGPLSEPHPSECRHFNQFSTNQASQCTHMHCRILYPKELPHYSEEEKRQRGTYHLLLVCFPKNCQFFWSFLFISYILFPQIFWGQPSMSILQPHLTCGKATHLDLLYSNSMCRQSSIPTSILMLLFMSGYCDSVWTTMSCSFTTSDIRLTIVTRRKYLDSDGGKF